MSARERAAVRSLHDRIGAAYPTWRSRIEGSYVTQAMLPSDDPPPQPRPYVNGGALWEQDPTYGQEWILNRYVLYECGIAIAGPDPKAMFRPVSRDAYRSASIRSLHEEWEPLLSHPAALSSAHQQAYVTLTICRILHAATRDGVISKRGAARWVQRRYGEPWRTLVEKAERWRHGRDLREADAVLAFIRFALRQVA
jgi:hypothetical protein